MLFITAGIHKMLVRIANREDPDQTASSNSKKQTNLGRLLCFLAGNKYSKF